MEIKYNKKAKNLTTYGGKGVVKEIYLPNDIEEAVALRKNKCDLHILGGGSNTLIPDGENAVPVVSFDNLNKIEIQGNTLKVGAGARVSRVITTARRYGLGGLEFLAGIPASIGGLVKMNAGAFGHEIGVYIDKIVSLSADNEIIEYCRPFDFGYRKGFGGIVIEVEMCLERMLEDKSRYIESRYINERRLRQPAGRSTGSVFKNAQCSAGYYVDKVGLKGMRVGGAQISQKHGNFIVNVDEGSADDFLALVEIMKMRVFEEFGVLLEKEFIILGEK